MTRVCLRLFALLLLLPVGWSGYAQQHISFVVDSIGYSNDTFFLYDVSAVDLQYNTPVGELVFPDKVVGPDDYGRSHVWTVIEVAPYHAIEALADGAIVTLPKYCEEVYNFAGTKIGMINFNDRLKVIAESAFARCDGLKSLNIPASVKTIGTSAFASCAGIESVDFAPNSKLERIRTLAFSGTGISEVKLPDNCEIVESWAFNMVPLRKLYLPRNFEKMNSNAFISTADTLHVYVPNCVASVKTISAGASYASFKAQEQVVVHVPVGTTTAFRQNAAWSCYQLVEDEEMGHEHLINVTVQRPDSGTVVILNATQLRPRQWVTDDGNRITIKCTPTANSEVFYCTVDGVDMSDQFNSNWELTIPAVDHDLEVYIGFAPIKTYVPLILKQGKDNDVTVLIYNNEPLKLNFTPDPGWKIHSVTINGKDITKKLDGYGDVTIRKVNGEIVVGGGNIGQDGDDNSPYMAYVAFENPNDALNSLDAGEGMRVYGRKGGLRIEQATCGSVINVCDIHGRVVFSTIANGTTVQVDLPGGLYIVTGGGKTVKIAL